MNDSIKSFEIFSKLEEVAEFLLVEAFQYAHAAAEYEVAGIIFGERIMAIDSNSEYPSNHARLFHRWPASLTEWLKDRDKMDEVIADDDTTALLAEAWQSAQLDADSSGKRLSKAHIFTSIDVIGHVINLSACIETVINRKLYLLLESNKLITHHYDSLDRTELLPKILFIFKDEIITKKLYTTRLKHLIKLRNEAVHFKASSVDRLTVTSEELLGIWNEVGDFFELVEGQPTKELMSQLTKEFINKWILN